MPYAKTKEGSLVNEVTLGDGYPLSNDLQPLKIGGEASILGISSPLPDGSDSGLFRVDGDLDITGTLKTKLSHDLIYDFDDEVNTLAQAKVDALIDSAPGALDTLNELAAALGDDASFSTTVTNSIATKLPLAGGTLTGALTIHSATDALLNFKTSDDSWAYMQFLQNDGTRRAYIGMDNDLNRLIINATENGATEVEINTTNLDINAAVQISGALTTTSTIDGVDIATRDGVLTSTTTTANNALPKAGGTLTGDLTINSPESKLIFRGDDTSENHEIESDGNLYITVDDDADDTNNFVQFRANSGGSIINLMKIQDDGNVDVNGDITGRDGKFTRDDTAILEVIALDGTGGIIGTDTNHDLLLRTNNSEKVRIATSGNVGIGTTSPDVALEINGGSGTDLDPLLRINKNVDGDGSATGILIGAVNAGQSKSGIFFENKGIGSGRGSLHFCSDNTSDTSDATIADARMTIIDGGNVGIGTTSPIAPLHIESTINALADTDEPENCHLLLRNAANDTNEGVGIGFLISAQTDDIGSSIVYKRTGRKGRS